MFFFAVVQTSRSARRECTALGLETGTSTIPLTTGVNLFCFQNSDGDWTSKLRQHCRVPDREAGSGRGGETTDEQRIQRGKTHSSGWRSTAPVVSSTLSSKVYSRSLSDVYSLSLSYMCPHIHNQISLSDVIFAIHPCIFTLPPAKNMSIDRNTFSRCERRDSLLPSSLFTRPYNI